MADFFYGIIHNRPFICALIGWFIAQGIKILTGIIRYRRFDVERIMGSGGMPSSHTTAIMAATVNIGRQQGFDNPIFSLGLVVSFLVMYDAANVRMAAGQQAKLIKQIIREIGEQRFTVERELKELLGHTYLEVFVGMILGIIVGSLF